MDRFLFFSGNNKEFNGFIANGLGLNPFYFRKVGRKRFYESRCILPVKYLDHKSPSLSQSLHCCLQC